MNKEITLFFPFLEHCAFMFFRASMKEKTGIS